MRLDRRLQDLYAHQVSPPYRTKLRQASGGRRESEVVQTKFMRVQDAIIDERWAPEWWGDLAKAERGDFERAARELQSRLAVLRTLVRQADEGGT